eukprot:12498251-Ditylum_brightwellii.AAC.1
MKKPDVPHFVGKVVKEINGLIERESWGLVSIEEIPIGTKILDAVWSIKEKRDIKTRKVTKCKARLNIHGVQQQYGIDFLGMYAPVVTWSSVMIISP